MMRMVRYAVAVVLAVAGTAVIALAAYVAYLVGLWSRSARREHAPSAR